MKNRYFLEAQICFLLIILSTGLCSSQEAKTTQIKFIRVCNTTSFPMPPFAKQEIEISNNQICFRNVLPPKEKANKNFLRVYDSLDTIPKFQRLEPTDYDSIVGFILTSGLLDIDLSYMKSDTTNNLIVLNIGGGSNRYVIETSLGKLDLAVLGIYDYKLPETLINFDGLFKRISKRYNDLKK
jgi:hypothetical protein